MDVEEWVAGPLLLGTRVAGTSPATVRKFTEWEELLTVLKGFCRVGLWAMDFSEQQLAMAPVEGARSGHHSWQVERPSAGLEGT